MLQCNCTKSDDSSNWVLRYINENAKRSAESILMLYIHFPLSFPVTSGEEEEEEEEEEEYFIYPQLSHQAYL